MKNDYLEEISRLVHGEGDPCDLGADASHIEKIVRDLESQPPWRPYCIVADWTWVDLISVDKDQFSKAIREPSAQPVGLYSNNVIQDQLGRCHPGECIRSTPLVEFRENCMFITRNTIYLMQGPGKRLRMQPNSFVSVLF